MKKIKSVYESKLRVKVNLLCMLMIPLLFFVSNSAVAQRKWSFDLRPGINFATTKLGDANLKTGFGAEGTFAYRFMPQVGLYAGWSWNRFSAEESFAGNNLDFEETGYCFGLQFVHPIQQSKASYMIKAGGTYNHIETENSKGDVINNTGHGLGWQMGVGAVLPLSARISLVPELRFRSLTRDFKVNDANTNAKLNYVSAGVGLSIGL